MDAQELRDWENNRWREVVELQKIESEHKLKAKTAKEGIEEIVTSIRNASLRLNTDQGELPLGVDGVVPVAEGEGGPPEEPAA